MSTLAMLWEVGKLCPCKERCQQSENFIGPLIRIPRDVEEI